jgi:hypothetical protein
MIRDLICKLFGHAKQRQADLGLFVVSLAQSHQCPRCGALVNSRNNVDNP